MSFFSWSLVVLTWLTPVAVREVYAPSVNATLLASPRFVVVERVAVLELAPPVDGLPLVRVMTRLLRGEAAAVVRYVFVVVMTFSYVFSSIVVVDVANFRRQQQQQQLCLR